MAISLHAGSVVEVAPKSATAISPNKSLEARFSQTSPENWRENLGRVVIRKRKHVLTEHYFGSRLIARAAWSPDSKFCVFTTVSSGGHSPWHFDSYVFRLSDLSFHYMDDVIGCVINPDFAFEAPSIAVMTIHDFSTGLDAPGAPKSVKVDLAKEVSKMELDK